MTAYGEVAAAVRALKAGAFDFIEKPFDEDTLLNAIAAAAEVGDGAPASAPGPGPGPGPGAAADGVGPAALAAAARLALLSRREREVLDRMVEGLPTKVIAAQLGLSPRTVEVHRSHVMGRLGVRSVAAAVRLTVLAEAAEAKAAGTPG